MRARIIITRRFQERHSLPALLLIFSTAIWTCLTVLPKDVSGQTKASSTEHYQKKYNFKSDWFTPTIPVWDKVLEPYKGKPNLNYLEVGTFQGRSFLWFLENVATHPSSRLTGIDIAISNVFLSNIKLSGGADRVTTIEGRSDTALRKLPMDSFDVIYIDGSHRGDDVLSDAVLSWALLRVGGLLIFDDYLWEMHYPNELRPKIAIDTFLTLYRSKLEVVHRGAQLLLKRKKSQCVFPHIAMGPERFCTPIGDYIYDWEWKKILDPRTKKEVQITQGEAAVAKQLIRSIPIGRTRVSAGQMSLQNKDLISLRKKLNLDLSPPPLN